METSLLPEQCHCMAEVRRGVDATDRELLRLLARRFGYMRAAARIKEERGMVRDMDRKAQVIANACADAQRLGAPVEVIEKLWDQLVEASIAYEMDEWDRIRNRSAV